MRVALYGRVSTKDRGQDVENQLRQLRAFAEAQNWQIEREYIDHASGKRADREQFRMMLEDASKRRFDILLFWALDRLTREGVLATLQYLQRLTDAGVGWKSYTEQYLDSTGIFRDAVVAILAAIAKQERCRIAERTLAGLERARKAGRFGGRPKKIVDREAMREMRAAGASYRQVAERFNVSRSFVFNLCGESNHE